MLRCSQSNITLELTFAKRILDSDGNIINQGAGQVKQSLKYDPSLLKCWTKSILPTYHHYTVHSLPHIYIL